jgi:hypothetical protein
VILGKGVAPVTVTVFECLPKVTIHGIPSTLFAVAHEVVPSVVYGRLPLQA